MVAHTQEAVTEGSQMGSQAALYSKMFQSKGIYYTVLVL